MVWWMAGQHGPCLLPFCFIRSNWIGPPPPTNTHTKDSTTHDASMRVGERHSGRRELNQLEDGVAHQDHEGHEHRVCVCG